MNYLPQFFPSLWLHDNEVYGIPFTEEISIGFVNREKGGYTYLLKEEFENLNIESKDLLFSAIKNLENEFENCDIKEFKIKGGILVSWNSENDNFSAIRILSKKYRNELNKIFKDDFNFSISDRDLISCWQTTDIDENEKFKNEAIEDYNESEYWLSNKIYKFSDIKLVI